MHFLQRGGETFRSKRPHGFVPAGWTESAVVGWQIECRHGGGVDAGAQGKCSGREGFWPLHRRSTVLVHGVQ